MQNQRNAAMLDVRKVCLAEIARLELMARKQSLANCRNGRVAVISSS